MNLLARIHRLPVLVILTVLLLGAVPAAAQDLVLLHLADTHAAYDRYPRLVSLVEETVAESADAHVAILIGGDVFEPDHAVSRGSEGAGDWAFLEALARIAPVILNVGNHEFDFLPPREFVAEARARGITPIGSLVDVDEGSMLVPPVTTLTVQGRTVDVVGIGTDQESTYVEDARAALLPADPLEFAERSGPLTVLADHVIVLTHAGVVLDRELLPRLPEATLYAVGGHDHLVLQDDVSGVPYLHAGFKGERLLIAEVTFADGGGVEVRFRERLTGEHDDVDADLERFLADLADEVLTDEDREVLGTVPEALTVREAADWAVRTLADATDADVALLNHTSFGAGLPEGPLERHRFDTFLRFDNEVMATEMEGATLARVLERADQGPETPLAARTGDFVYTSGVDGEVDEDRSYRVATSSWIAMPFNQQGFLGVEGVEFEQVEGVTVKGILIDALR